MRRNSTYSEGYGIPTPPRPAQSLPGPVSLDLVLVAQTGHDDVGRLRHIDIDLVRPGAEPEPLLAVDAEINAAENRFFIVALTATIRDPGRHVFRITVEGNARSARTLLLDIRQLG